MALTGENTTMASSKDLGVGPVHSDVRRRSVGTIEINAPDGHRKTVQLEDLSAADRELAEKFGYKPVRQREDTHTGNNR
jgi:hypothetical protein